ncbi:MAG: preprotein translocase subunit SecE [Gemmatimonadota bacterium]
MAAEQGSRSLVQNTRSFVEDCWAELHKVTWPDWPQTRNATWVIILFVVLVSAVIWVMDLVARGGINMILSIFGAA